MMQYSHDIKQNRMKNPVYLDYNATTPLLPEVTDAMRPFMQEAFGNPSSSHLHGVMPRRAVESAREQVASLLHCHADEIVFTSGGTESNNQAIIGIARSLRDKGRHIITSAIEHPAVLSVCAFLETEGVETTYLPVDGNGCLQLSDVEAAIRPETILITVMHANNETGSIQPVSGIGELARRYGIVFHTDAAQSAGKIETNVNTMATSLVSIAGHKMYAPKGVGALYVRRGITLPPLMHGAGQECGRRAGTENTIHIAGLGKACEIAMDDAGASQRQMQHLRDRLHDGLQNCGTDVRLNGHPKDRLPNTLNISFRGLEANRILEEIGLNVSASAGAACHSDGVDLSHVLVAMQVPEEWAKGTVRFSLGRTTTEEEVDRAAAVVSDAVKRLSRI